MSLHILIIVRIFITMITTAIACRKMRISWDNSKLNIISLGFLYHEAGLQLERHFNYSGSSKEIQIGFVNHIYIME